MFFQFLLKGEQTELLPGDIFHVLRHQGKIRVTRDDEPLVIRDERGGISAVYDPCLGPLTAGEAVGIALYAARFKECGILSYGRPTSRTSLDVLSYCLHPIVDPAAQGGMWQVVGTTDSTHLRQRDQFAIRMTNGTISFAREGQLLALRSLTSSERVEDEASDSAMVIGVRPLSANGIRGIAGFFSLMTGYEVFHVLTGIETVIYEFRERGRPA